MNPLTHILRPETSTWYPETGTRFQKNQTGGKVVYTVIDTLIYINISQNALYDPF